LLERVSSYSRLFELIGALLRDALTRCHAQKLYAVFICVFALSLFEAFVSDARSNSGASAAADDLQLRKVQKLLASKKYLDLTHEFAPGIPRWPGFPDETRKTIYWYDKRRDTMGSGFFAELFTHVGQWGTHVDPRAHFVKGLRTVDQIDPQEMILPLVVIDVHQEVTTNPDYTLSLERVKKWEKDHSQIPAGAFVAMRTDWSKRWPDAAKMGNKDANGVAHYPGWSLPALKYLYEERKITASGHETTDTDPGLATKKDDYSLETYILSTNHYQIELLTNLDQVPESGAIVVVSFPKPKGGSGFPGRVFAILP
jgi:kynurenine formamidase